MPPKFNVLGVAVSAMNLRAATDLVVGAAKSGRAGYVCVSGVHGVSEAQRDTGFKRILNGAFLNTTDGMPLVWLAKHYCKGVEVGRVYGPDLMLEVFRATQGSDVTHFLCGGAEGVAEMLKGKLIERFPGVKIAGTFCPPFRELTVDDERAMLKKIHEAKPGIIWVGLGSPKQERFMARYLPMLGADATIMIGVGAAFDFHTGRLRQAPRWMQRCGLEWFFRLCVEPRRLWRRYLINNPLFIFRITLQLLGLKRYPLEEGSDGR